jgi:hypothetical protein
MNLQRADPPKTLRLVQHEIHLIHRVFLVAQAAAVPQQLLQVLQPRVWGATPVAVFVNRLRCAVSLVSSQHMAW